MSALALARFIEANIEAGSQLLTDGHPSYPTALRWLDEQHGLYYDPKATVRRGATLSASVPQPHVHRVAALLKRWWLGTHQGAIDGAHIQSDLDEFVFRFNRRRSQARGLLFWRLVFDLADSRPVTFTELRAEWHNPPEMLRRRRVRRPSRRIPSRHTRARCRSTRGSPPPPAVTS